ncbi:MAG TPA: type II toxin-antitoxin system antitoxin SocA domain-containing protein [Lysobacter sp.]|nr:type II toxin-antitoxin system antitoxin SocA domain-containing protein [Lysobacter sp.]
MSSDGRAVANFVLDLCDSEGRPITNLSLQKIVFFCHAWSLAELGEPLIKHQFEAWQFGPVIQYLYRDFRGFDRKPITSRASKLDPETGRHVVVGYSFDVQTVEFLEKVVRFYSRLSAGTLVELSHVEGGPWHEVWNHDGKVNPGMRIDNDRIASYYATACVPF